MTFQLLNQFDYGQPQCTVDKIRQTITGSSRFRRGMYIGAKLEGTDIFDGIGILVTTAGDVQEGYWKDGCQHGRGRHIYTTGAYYIGDWKNGDWHGQGTWYGHFNWSGVSSGEYMKGEFKLCELDGQGEKWYKNGTKYIGEWSGGRRNGQGTLYAANGQVLQSGRWENNEYVGVE